eukprot:IDg23202t1
MRLYNFAIHQVDNIAALPIRTFVIVVSKGFDCMERERTDLAGRECTRRQAYSADTVGRRAIEGSATMLE